MNDGGDMSDMTHDERLREAKDWPQERFCSRHPKNEKAHTGIESDFCEVCYGNTKFNLAREYCLLAAARDLERERERVLGAVSQDKIADLVADKSSYKCKCEPDGNGIKVCQGCQEADVIGTAIHAMIREAVGGKE